MHYKLASCFKKKLIVTTRSYSVRPDPLPGLRGWGPWEGGEGNGNGKREGRKENEGRL